MLSVVSVSRIPAAKAQTGTFGNTGQGNFSSDVSSQLKDASYPPLVLECFTSPNDVGTIFSVAMLLSEAGEGTVNFYGVIYSNNNGSPGTLLVQSAESTVNGVSWTCVNFPINYVGSPNTVYWIGVFASADFYFEGSSANSSSSAVAYASNTLTFGNLSNQSETWLNSSITLAPLYVLYNSPNGAPTTTQTHGCPYSLLMPPNDDEDDWSVNISSDYEVVLTNTMTARVGQNQYLSVWGTDPVVGDIWNIDFQNSTYLDSLSGNNGNAGQLNSNGTLTIIVKGTNITFETAYGSVSSTVMKYYPSLIITNNENYHATLLTGELDITLTACTPASATPPGEGNTSNPTPTLTTALTSTHSPSSALPFNVDFWPWWLLAVGVLLIVGVVVTIAVANRRKQNRNLISQAINDFSDG